MLAPCTQTLQLRERGRQYCCLPSQPPEGTSLEHRSRVFPTVSRPIPRCDLSPSGIVGTRRRVGKAALMHGWRPAGSTLIDSSGRGHEGILGIAILERS